MALPMAKVSPGPPHYIYQATILGVHDADTIEVSLRTALRSTRTVNTDLGLHLHVEGGFLTRHDSVRLVGLNAAELVTAAGKAAREALLRQIPIDSTVRIGTHLDRTEKYGRLLGQVWRASDGLYINQWLIDNNYAAAWDGHGPAPTT